MNPSETEDDARDLKLEMSGAEFQTLVADVAARLAEQLDTLPNQRAAYLGEGDATLAQSVREALPERGLTDCQVRQLLDDFFQRLVPHSYNTASPGYMAYIPGGGLPLAAVADLISNIVNRYVGVWLAAPALVQLETNVIRWFCQIVGLPETAGGLLTTGGSMANWTALVTARRSRLPENFLRGTMYVSRQAHHSVRKAALLTGFPESNVRVVACDEQFRMRTSDLARQVAQDRKDGWQPFAVVSSAGTTNTGAIDPLPELADLCRREDLWLHVDAAYGGFFGLTQRGARRLAGIEHADSITLDPHKGLFLPYGNGCLLVREPDTLRRAHQLDAEYLPSMQHDPDHVDYCALGPELSRDFRGLRVWLPLKMLGAELFRRCLDEKLDLAEWAAAELQRIAQLQIVAPPQLSLLAFRYQPKDWSGTAQQLDEINRKLIHTINQKGTIYLTGTSVNGHFAIRMCILSFRTHHHHVAECLALVRQAVSDLSG